MNKTLLGKLDEIQRLCKTHRVHSLYAFGSVATEKFNEQSDVDFLIDFENGLSINEYTDNYFDMQFRLHELLNRNVDLVTQRSLSNPYFIQSIEKTKQLLYAS